VSESNQQTKKVILSKKIGYRKEEQKKEKIFGEATFICIETPPKTCMCLDGSMHTIRLCLVIDPLVCMMNREDTRHINSTNYSSG
jgi:hypothetical protein